MFLSIFHTVIFDSSASQQYCKPSVTKERLFHDFALLCWSKDELAKFISSNEMFAHWLNHPYRQPISLFSIFIGLSIIWTIKSYFSSWRERCAAAARTTSKLAPQEAANPNSRASQSAPQTVDCKTMSPPETPVRHEVTPFFAGSDSNDSPSTIGVHVPFGIGKHVDGRTGRVSTPEYQTPFIDNSDQRNFSALAKTAPSSYNTLQQNCILNEDGTPTKKYGPDSRKGDNRALGSRKTSSVYDSPTRTWGNKK